MSPRRVGPSGNRLTIREYLPMDVFNLFADQDWDHGNDRPGYGHSRTVIGERLGATLLGGSLYELPPARAHAG